ERGRVCTRDARLRRTAQRDERARRGRRRRRARLAARGDRPRAFGGAGGGGALRGAGRRGGGDSRGEVPRGAGRGVWRDAGGVSILDDTYTANPVSVRAALETVAARRAASSGRLIVVLGDMLELGAIAEEAHQEMGRRG